MPPRGWPIRSKPEEQKPIMNDATNVTPLPIVEMAPEQPKLVVTANQVPSVSGITGAGSLGTSIADLIDAISAEVDGAFQDIQDSAKELRAGINTAKGVSKHLKGEAAQIREKLGRFGNFKAE